MTKLARPLRIAAAAVAFALILGAPARAPASAHPRAEFPVQSMGDRGPDVTALQHLLRFRGHNVEVTGSFNPETQSAVSGFQDEVGLGDSGVANVATWEALVPNLAEGDDNEAVIALKKQLNAKRKSGLTDTSAFNAATRDAVRAFQKHIGLSRTGDADRTTWRNLIWHFMRPDFSRPSLCNYNGGHTNGDWGTAATIAHLHDAADLFRTRAGGKVAIGDLSFEHGGEISLHNTHEHGLDIDIALIRQDGRQCSNPGISYTSGQYDRPDTRQLLQAIHDELGSHLKLIYFNDPQMIAEGLSRKFANHNDHIHVRLCEP
ncbi:MAG TPA: penicillin-insensitive murein endopeptidase, partial [Candidatus Limnocylindrales bacterium]|nr:penicillin-insensitive murein endopeptidase [Candidatus Limnocylindrales bacterium]